MCQQIIPAQTSEENQTDYGKNRTEIYSMYLMFRAFYRNSSVSVYEENSGLQAETVVLERKTFTLSNGIMDLKQILTP
jgi:hypothetical protein